MKKQCVSWRQVAIAVAQKKIPREKFAELREVFQALSRSEQDMF